MIVRSKMKAVPLVVILATLVVAGCSKQSSEPQQLDETMNKNTSFESLAREATREFQARNYGTAVKILEEGGERWGNTVDYLQLLGGAYLADGQIDEAETTFARAQELFPSFQNQFNLAECAFARGDYQLAKREFEAAYSYSPDDPAHRSIAAFKVIVSAGLIDSRVPEASEYEEALSPTGRHYLKIVRSAWDEDASRATALLMSPETNSTDAAPYVDTLRTSGILGDEK